MPGLREETFSNVHQTLVRLQNTYTFAKSVTLRRTVTIQTSAHRHAAFHRMMSQQSFAV